jgi:hypothetical protein
MGLEPREDDDTHQDAAWADAVTEPAAGDLENRVGAAERRQRPAHVRRAQAET